MSIKKQVGLIVLAVVAFLVAAIRLDAQVTASCIPNLAQWRA